MNTTTTAGTDGWDRRRLLRTLLLLALTGLALLVGLGYAVHAALSSAGPQHTPTPATAPAAGQAGQAAHQLPAGQARRDAIAAAPMLAVPPEAARAGTPTGDPGPALSIPAAGTLGPAGIPTGFPHTPAGAVGQLSAITTSVLQGMSIEQARTVYRVWSVPDAPPAWRWELLGNIQAFLGSAAGQYTDTPSSTVVVVTPVAGQVKGVDGPDWVLACVLLDVRARAATTARIAYGHCARMQWSTGSATTERGRWVIAAGPAPARAPSTWPGTDLAARAGWRPWAPAGEAGWP